MTTIGGMDRAGKTFYDKKAPATAVLPLSARKKMKAKKSKRGRTSMSPGGGQTARGNLNQDSAENLVDDASDEN